MRLTSSPLLCSPLLSSPLLSSPLLYTRWDQHPAEALHAEFFQMILEMQKTTPTNAFREISTGNEHTKRPLIIWMHLHTSHFILTLTNLTLTDTNDFYRTSAVLTINTN